MDRQRTVAGLEPKEEIKKLITYNHNDYICGAVIYVSDCTLFPINSFIILIVKQVE